MRQWLRLVPLLALGAGVMGCTQSEGLPHIPTNGPATITVHAALAPGGAMYDEGALPQVIVRNADGTVAAHQLQPEPRFRSALQLPDLEPGNYVLHAGLRPCDGSCDNLDPLTDVCQTNLTLIPGPWDVRVTFHTGRSCAIKVTGPGYAAPARP